MIFAIDFDGTYAEDPVSFDKMIHILQEAGHTCIMVTQRSDEHDWGAEIRRTLITKIPIVFSSGKTKNTAALEAGYNVNVWIDDNPLGIYESLVYIGHIGQKNE